MQLKSPIPSAKDHLKPTRAFTLLEMLVTVFIVAVLAALLLPAIRSFIEKGAAITCANNMRQLGSALKAFQGEHNGWFYPGYPMSPSKIAAADQQPGMPLQTGASNYDLNLLAPEYMDELPICPLAQLAPRFRAANPRKPYFRARGGTYAMNASLVQAKESSFPFAGWYPIYQTNYSASRMPFLTESGWGGVTWAFSHCNQALEGLWYGATGTGTQVTMGRNHGYGGQLNFMFLDQHIELVDRGIPGQEDWAGYGNPKRRFDIGGGGGRFISVKYLYSQAGFENAYPQFYPPPEP